MPLDFITINGLAILIVAIAAFIAVFYVLKVIKYLIVNSVVGLILLFASNVAIKMFDLGFSVDINWVSVMICALAGIPGVLIVILLGFFNIPLVPA
ncbi:MAG: pro-sigmaK processing inhibitor BofA family protein [Methanosarcinales archaeon]|nr:pro-sigmaK processing inhibitor BofA family protein [ANME-2 cluster archaeon]MDF1532091.1 pro-sigmaK processing inhibitor BofA family protein [ANME-2 cluster archaeon]MDW7776988.1 pro-sigmaK processing inhibitor BofA family protein [Methanosarcinales archaeon]